MKTRTTKSKKDAAVAPHRRMVTNLATALTMLVGALWFAPTTALQKTTEPTVPKMLSLVPRILVVRDSFNICRVGERSNWNRCCVASDAGLRFGICTARGTGARPQSDCVLAAGFPLE